MADPLSKIIFILCYKAILMVFDLYCCSWSIQNGIWIDTSGYIHVPMAKTYAQVRISKNMRNFSGCLVIVRSSNGVPVEVGELDHFGLEPHLRVPKKSPGLNAGWSSPAGGASLAWAISKLGLFWAQASQAKTKLPFSNPRGGKKKTHKLDQMHFFQKKRESKTCPLHKTFETSKI